MTTNKQSTAIILLANKPDQYGRIYSEEALKLIAKNNPKNFQYDATHKGLITSNRNLMDVMQLGIVVNLNK